MSLKASNKVDTNRYELEITIDGPTFVDAIRKVYSKNSKKMNVPGFRKGKAPMNIIEKYYGESVFFEDALNLLYSDALDDAAKEAGLTIIDDKMDFDLVSINKQDGVDFKVTLTTKPEAEVGTYKGLAVERVTPVVSDDEIAAEIDRLSERNSRMVAVEDRAAQDGDTAVIDFEGFVDGVAFEGGKAEGHSLVLGSGQFIPGFEEQVTGHNTGDEFDVTVTFPEEYQAAELAGKEAVFKVKLHEVKAKEMPVIDDEFAKDVSEFDTLEALKDDLKAKALERKTQNSDDDMENQLIDQIIDGMTAEIPDAMIAGRVEQSVKDFEYRMQMQGMTLDTYLQYTGTKIEDLKQNFLPQAERQVKIRLALEKIVQLEGIQPTEEEITAEFAKLAESYSVEIEKVKMAIPESEVTADIAVKKAIDLVKASAKVTEVEKKTETEEVVIKTPAKKATKKDETDEKAPAKKTAAKKTASKKSADSESEE